MASQCPLPNAKDGGVDGPSLNWGRERGRSQTGYNQPAMVELEGSQIGYNQSSMVEPGGKLAITIRFG